MNLLSPYQQKLKQAPYEGDAPECVIKLTYGRGALGTSLTTWLLTGFMFSQLFCLGPVHGFVGLLAAPVLDALEQRVVLQGDSVGISGIMGILGGYLAYAYFVGAPWWHSFMGVAVVLNFVGAFVYDQVKGLPGKETDHWAHFAGLGMGVALGFLVIGLLGFGFGKRHKRTSWTLFTDLMLALIMQSLLESMAEIHGTVAGHATKFNPSTL